MSNWCPTDAGFDILAKTGLDKRIDKRWDEMRQLIPMTAIFEDYMLEDRLNADTPPARRRAIKNWIKKDVSLDKPTFFFIVSGTVTDALLNKDEKANVQKFGVEDISQLDSLLACYAEAKYWDDQSFGRPHYVWRSPGLKTQIYGDMHGDLAVHQLNTKPKIDIGALDGKELVQLYGELPTGHIHPDYGYWPVLAAIALKYADTIGVEIPEAKNWQEFMKEYRWDEKIANPGMNGIGYDRFACDYSNEIIAQMPDKMDMQKVRKMFFGQMRPNANQEVTYLPIIDEEQRLLFCTNYTKAKEQEGDIKVGGYNMQMPFRTSVVIPKEDAGHLFKGAVHGIMTNQSRTSPCYLAYMLWEYDQLKAGKSEDAIHEEGHEKYGKGW